jgi:hypothetical protein
VDAEIWKKIRDLYADTQVKDGWSYATLGDDGPTHSMTIAGLLGLAVAVKYDKNAKGPDPAFEKGMKALLDGKRGEFGNGKSWFVSWMTVAELGRALGSDEFKSDKVTKKWYREGAEKIVKNLQADGSLAFPNDPERTYRYIDDKWPVVTTACGLYFLGPPKK